MLQIIDRHKKILQDDNCNKELFLSFPNGVRLNNKNIVNGEYSLTESFCSQDELKFGLCEASILEFEAMNVGDLTGEEFEASLCVSTIDPTTGAESVFFISLGIYKVDSCQKQKSGSHKIVAYNALVQILNDYDVILANHEKRYSYYEPPITEYSTTAEEIIKSSIPWKYLNLSGGVNVPNTDSTRKFSDGETIKVKLFDLDYYNNKAIKIDITFNQANLKVLKKYVSDSVFGFISNCNSNVSLTLDVTGAGTVNIETVNADYLYFPKIDYVIVHSAILEIPVSINVPITESNKELEALMDAEGYIEIISNISVQAFEPESKFANNPTIKIPCTIEEVGGIDDIYFFGKIVSEEGQKVKDYLQALLELNGMFGVMSKTTGKLEYRTLDLYSADADIDLGLSNRKIYCSTDILAGQEIICGEGNDYFISNLYEDYMVEPFGTICVKYKELDAATNKEVEKYYYHSINENYENTYYLTDNKILLENVFTLDEIKAICEVLAPNIANRSFVPSEVELPSRPWIEAGDSFTTAEGNKAYVLDKKSTLLFDTYTAKGSKRN